MAASGENEHGLTLVEMLIAIFVISIVLMAMAATAITAMRSMVSNESVVNATQLGTELLETYLARDFDDLGLYEDDADAAFGAVTFDGAPLVRFPNPSVPDYTRVPEASQTVSRGNLTYEARTAVVWEDDSETDPDDDFKRVIVELSWDVRGTPRTSKVEALVARDPAEQMLSVVVTPDTVPISDTGHQQTSFTIEVEAADEQSAVVVKWEDRDGSEQSRSLSDAGGGLTWQRTFNSQNFANGGTLFTVVGTLAGTTQKDVTTIGRALFLQELALPPGRTTATPAELSYHPQDGYCEPSLRIDAEAVGAIFSDPAFVTVGEAGSEVDFPMDAIDTLIDGTRYRSDIDLEDLGIQDGDTEVPVTVTVTRPTGETEITVTKSLTVPIEVLETYTDEEDEVTGYEPCPT